VDLDQKLKEKIKLILDELFQENKIFLEKLEKDLMEFNIKERSELEYDKFDLYKDIYYLDSLKVKDKNKNIIEGIELYPKLFDVVDTTNITNNSNRNFIKNVNGWRGIKGNPISADPGVYKYSIRIDKCTNDCNIC